MTNHPNRNRGRPALPPEQRKRTIGISLSPDVIEALRSTGPGWMVRADEILRTALLQ